MRTESEKRSSKTRHQTLHQAHPAHRLPQRLTQLPPGAPASRACWARLIRKVFEVDPLICARCGGEMKVIAVLTAPKVVDRIVRHLQEKAESERAPPGAAPQSHLSSEESVPAR